MNTYMKQIEASALDVHISARTRDLIQDSCMEFSIINSKKRGKCIYLSKDLALALGITDSIDVIPIAKEGLIMVSAKRLPFDAACRVSLNDNGGDKIAYNSALVDLLVEELDIDFFSEFKTDQMNIHKISFHSLTNGTPVALIRVYFVDEYPYD